MQGQIPKRRPLDWVKKASHRAERRAVLHTAANDPLALALSLQPSSPMIASVGSLLLCLVSSAGLRLAAAQTQHRLVARAYSDDATRCAFVDTSLGFERDGQLMSWDIYASRTGQLHPQVYRPTAGGYQVVCDNRIKTKTANAIVHYELAEDDVCNVQAGDVVGWYHAGPGIIDFDRPDSTIEQSGSVMSVCPVDRPTFGAALSAQQMTADQRTYSIGATVVYGEPAPEVRPADCGPCNREHGHCASATLCSCSGGYSGPSCEDAPTVQTIGNELADRRTPDSAAGIAFVDTGIVFTRPGRIVGWSFFVGRVGDMELLVWRRTGENSYQLVCANDVHGSVAGSVEQVEVDQADQCEVLPQDVAGWWHAGQGVIDFDAPGGNAVMWATGYGQSPGIGEEVAFGGNGMRTYSLAVSVVYADEACGDLQQELAPIVAACCDGGNCEGGGMPTSCSAPTCAAVFTRIYQKCEYVIAQDPAADLYATFNGLCVLEEGVVSQW